MKYLFYTIVCIMMLTSVLTAQFRGQVQQRPSVSEAIVRGESNGFLFSWLNLNNLKMNHTLSYSYMTVGGQAISVGMYTNSLFYQISAPLSLQFDVSLMHSPYSSFGNQKDLSGIYLTRAQLNYRPSENLFLQIQFRQLPSMYWWGAGRYTDEYPAMYNGIQEQE